MTTPAEHFRAMPIDPAELPACIALLQLIDEMIEARGRARTEWFVSQLLDALRAPQ